MHKTAHTQTNKLTRQEPYGRICQCVSMTTGSKTPGVPLENIEAHDSLDEVASLFA